MMNAVLEAKLLCRYDDRIEDLAVVGEGLAVACRDGSVALWIHGESRLLARFEDEGPAFCVAPETGSLLVGTREGVFRIPLGKGKPKRVFQEPDCFAVAIDARDGCIAIANHDDANGSEHPVVCLDGNDHEIWRTRVEHWPYTVVFSPDGRHVLTGTWEGDLATYEAKTGELEETRTRHYFGGPVYDLVWTTPTELAVGALDGSLTMWNVANSCVVAKPDKVEGGVHAVAISGDGELLAFAGNGQTVFLREARSSRLLGTLDLRGLQLGASNAASTNRDFPSSAEFYAVRDRAVTAMVFRGRTLFVGAHDGALLQLTIRSAQTTSR